MTDYRENKWVTIRTRRKSRCHRCRATVPKGIRARYNPAFRTLVHEVCRPMEDSPR